MKLLELEPRWLAQDGRIGLGVCFLCPLHRDHRIGVFFKNPVDGGAPQPGHEHLWTRDGDTFETLTLGPSLNVLDKTVFPDNVSIVGHWHGFVRNGEVSNA